MSLFAISESHLSTYYLYAKADDVRTLIARHRLFSVIFSLFVLAGVSPPAPQKEKIPRKFLCGGCVQFSRSGFLS